MTAAGSGRSRGWVTRTSRRDAVNLRTPFARFSVRPFSPFIRPGVPLIIPAMPRTRRPYLPRAFFHLTARTQDRAKWFASDDIKDVMVSFLAEATAASDCDLTLFAIMDNHVHVVVRQRDEPVWRFMQPFLRRTALLIQRRIGVDGHVFARVFAHRVCTDAEHLRTWTRYVHRNPVKAGLCMAPNQYRWSSHHAWSPAPRSDQAWIKPIPEIFAISDACDNAALRARHVEYVSSDIVPTFHFHHGNAFWHEHLQCPPLPAQRTKRKDLRDIVHAGLADVGPGLSIDDVRILRGAEIRRVRKILAVRAAVAGHRGCDIARFLNVSDATVSRITKADRLNRDSNWILD